MISSASSSRLEPALAGLVPPNTTKTSSLRTEWSPDEGSSEMASKHLEQDRIIPPLPAALTARPRHGQPSHRNHHLRHQSLSALPTHTMPLTGDSERRKSRGGLTGWFSGNTDNGRERERERPKIEISPVDSSTRSSRFSIFSSSPSPQTVQVSSSLDDEFLSLDIDHVLFPGGVPTEQDTFSPAAFKNLRMNAEGSLRKLQTAYRQRTVALNDSREELEESETRAKHLKLQLEDMARRVSEKEREIERLMGELAEEKGQRRSRAGSTSLDLRKKAWRKSSAYDSEDEDEKSMRSESIFSSRSRSPSPTFTTSTSLSDGAISPTVKLSTPSNQPGAFQRIIRGIRNEEVENCTNCRGNDVRVAWDTVGILKAENKGLKDRVAHLEGAVDGALDLVMGVAMERK